MYVSISKDPFLRVVYRVGFLLALKVQLRKDNLDGSEEYTDPVLRHKQGAILQNSEIKGALNQAFPTIQETVEKWTQRESGWVVDRVEVLWLDIARYQPLRGGSYSPLPAVVRSKYPTNDGLDFEWIDAPTPISQVPKVELQNNLAINVFGWNKEVIIYHLSKQQQEIPRIKLLLIEKAGKFHYARIKDLNRLLHDQSKHKERKHFCERCLHGYTREDLLEAHKPECRGIGQTAVRVEMLEEGKNKLAFQNHHKQLPTPYIIYADFGALTT